jgi:hypothetical protein
MTSLKQFEANRRNALKSTGPRTEEGKLRASRNAVRHGLTAETVVEAMEDPEDYTAFEQAVTADYDAETAVERELVLRLASLLWRLRRTTLIESGLLQLAAENPPVESEKSPQTKSIAGRPVVTALFRLGERATGGHSKEGSRDGRTHTLGNDIGAGSETTALEITNIQGDAAQLFIRLANLDNAVFDRLSRYELALWRQVRQTIFTLEGLRWRSLSARRPSQHFWRRTSEGQSD